MARRFEINGEVLVQAKVAAGTLISIGLTSDSIIVTPNFYYSDVKLDAWGGTEGPPIDVQWMLADAQINMTLIHFDWDNLQLCLRASTGNRAVAGTMARAGTLLGNQVAIGDANSRLTQLYLSSPIGGVGRTWYFPATFLSGPPMRYPLGTHRSEVEVVWRAIPYAVDPYGAANGAQDVTLWNNFTIV